MSSPIPAVRHLLASTRKSVRGARPGSILILVVALLVLVAIIGTAALSTNTIDRYATGQNNANTQIDLLVEGVKNMAKSVLVGDLQGIDAAGTIQYRPEGSLTYDHWDMPLLVDLGNRPTGMRKELFEQLKQANDAWLSPRYPDLLKPHPDTTKFGLVSGTFAFNVNSYAANPPVWDCIGAPLENLNGVASTGQLLFDTPGVFNLVGGIGSLDATAARGYNNRITDRRSDQDLDTTNDALNDNPLVPRTISYITSTGTFTAPAWRINNKYYIAADADGDGIADSGLKRINVGDINGLTYYYAVRIVDNGSAINVNTALSREHDFLGDSGDGQGTQAMSSRAGAPVPLLTNVFPASIGLTELLKTSNSSTATSLAQLHTTSGTLNEIGRIDSYRFNGVLIPPGIVTDQAAGTALPANQVYVDDSNTGSVTARTDFVYNTIGEFLHYGLGRRIGNPGFLEANNTRFNPFSVSESAALAYHFVLTNPDASRSALESATVLGTPNAGGTATINQDSLFYSASNQRRDHGPAFLMLNEKAYPKTDLGVGYWFSDNFDWNSELDANGLEVPANYRNRRAMLTADNPVSNQIPLPAGLTLSAVTKASVNTASFGQLYSAFFSVMSEGGADSPYRSPGAAAAQQPPPVMEQMYLFTGMRFAQSTPTNMGTVGVSNPLDQQKPEKFLAQQGGDTNIDRMFRTPIRDNFTFGDRNSKYDEAANTVTPQSDTSDSVHMQPKHVRRLRAFLAAANAVSMRYPTRSYVPFVVTRDDGSYTSNPLLARINNADTPIDVVAYPAEPQPFITEVYANTDTNRAAEDYDPVGAAGFGKNDEPYVAIELFYPYPIDNVNPTQGSGAPWDMRPFQAGNLPGWTIELIDRTSARTNGNLTVTPIATINATNAFFDMPTSTGVTDPRYGSYIILENFDENSQNHSTDKVKYRPRSSGLPYQDPLSTWHSTVPGLPPIKSVYVKDLAKFIKRGQAATDLGGELLISRPVMATGATAYIPPRPIDSFDFTGLEVTTGTAYTMHYCRQGKTIAGTGEWWSFIYPGRYDGGLSSTAGAIGRRHQGMQIGQYDNGTALPPAPTPVPDGLFDPFDRAMRRGFDPLDPKVTLGGEYQEIPLGSNTYVAVPTDNASALASYPSVFKTQLLNEDQPGWNPVGGYRGALGTAPPNKFPFGAFARNTDIMQIPYFAAYRIKRATGIFPNTPLATADIEINSISMDAAFCEDTDVYDDETSVTAFGVGLNTYEQLGRFCPIATDLGTAPNNVYAIDDLDPAPAVTYKYFPPDPPANDPNTGLQKKAWRMRWATRLFDYLTVQDPQSDYLPNVDPNAYQTFAGAGNRPVPVSNDGGTAADPLNPNPTLAASLANVENAASLNGLININTASWRVLSAINWTPFPAGSPNRDRFRLIVRPEGEFEMEEGANQVDDNIELAKAIAWWRDGKDAVTTIPVVNPGPDAVGGPIGPKGPFRSAYDLYRVWALRTYYNALGQPPLGLGEPDDVDDDFSPFNSNPKVTPAGPMPTIDEIRYDFEERYRLIARVGNLITTRSDSFTVYIVVQGWRNANSTDATKPPELVVQRRAAFIADRSGVTATGGSLKITNVASE